MSSEPMKIEKSKRITGSTRDKLAANMKNLYEKGASIRQLAEATGRSYGFMHRLLSDTGVTLRGRGGTPSAKNTRRARAGAAESGSRASKP